MKSLLKILNKNKKKTDRLSMEELAEFVRVIFDQATSITLDNRCVYLTHDLENEKRFARLMAERLVAEHIRAEKGKKDPYVRVAGNDLRLSAEQEAAVAAAFQHDTVIITGGPGTGKTTVLDTFIKWYRKRFPAKSRMLLVAPTGRASRRMAEATGREAYTIHRAFQLGSEGDSFKEDKRAADVIIVDEFSMSDMWVSAAMLSMISRDTKLIFVGDPMQLPSVGPGSVLNEIIACGIIPTIHLKTVFRQAAGSSIAENAQRIEYASRKILARDQDGNFKYEFLKYDDDTIFLSADDQDEASESVCQLYERAAKALGAEKVQILAPLKSKGACSVNKLNAAIQFILREDPQMGFKAGKDRYFCEGDPVIQLKNVNGVCNGDMGIVSGLSSDGVAVQYAGVDGPRVYKGDNLRIIMLAFALTIHKSQGSEYPLVIIPVLDAHAFMLNKNLIYTALTRGKRRVVFVGSEYALRMAALKKDANMRNTNLAKRIVAIYKKLLEECICQQEDAAASA